MDEIDYSRNDKADRSSTIWSTFQCISQFSDIEGLTYIRPHFTQGVKLKVQLKSSIPIDAKVEISPQGLYTRSQG
jgi:hypothetical protein